MVKKTSAGSTQNQFVLVDVNFSGFLDDLEKLTSSDLNAVQAVIDKIQKMTWTDIYKTSSKTRGSKRGLNYEPLNQETSLGHRIASIRINAKFRARVCRQDRFMRFISLHPDHDSAYKAKCGDKLEP